MVSSLPATADVLIIGDGLIGLSIAFELSRQADVLLVGGPLKGTASSAAAGLLLPMLERLPPSVRPFFADSLERFPAFIESLNTFDPGLALIRGIVDRGTEAEVVRPNDGAVDNVRLLSALRFALAAAPRVTLVNDFVSAVALSTDGIQARTRGGGEVLAKRTVLAAGAWSPQVSGLPRPLPVRPLKGQMLAVGASPLERPMMDDAVYLVPRGDETLVGATVEEAGFDVAVMPEAVAALRASAVALCPELASAEITRTWAGIRPATPDMLPILGADPEWPSLFYACGHSKNGVLLAPATAVAIAALCLDETPPVDIRPFSVSRFL